MEGDLIEPATMQEQWDGAKDVDIIFPSGIDCGHEFSASDQRVDRRGGPAVIPHGWLDPEKRPEGDR